jgi:hypothetical protein
VVEEPDDRSPFVSFLFIPDSTRFVSKKQFWGVFRTAGRKRMPWSRAEGQRCEKAEFSRIVAKESTFLV